MLAHASAKVRWLDHYTGLSSVRRALKNPCLAQTEHKGWRCLLHAPQYVVCDFPQRGFFSSLLGFWFAVSTLADHLPSNSLGQSAQ